MAPPEGIQITIVNVIFAEARGMTIALNERDYVENLTKLSLTRVTDQIPNTKKAAPATYAEKLIPS